MFQQTFFLAEEPLSVTLHNLAANKCDDTTYSLLQLGPDQSPRQTVQTL